MTPPSAGLPPTGLPPSAVLDAPDDASGDAAPPPRPLPPGLVLLAAIPLAVVALLLALSFTGALQGVSVLDAGPVVDVGLPVARAVQDGAAAVTIGFLVLAATALPGARSGSKRIGRSQWVAARWALRAGAVWLVAVLADLVFEAADVMGVPLSSPGFLHQLVFLSLHVELGQTLLVSAGLVAATLVVLLASRRTTAVALAAVLALAALLPLALGGHAAGSAEHGNAVNALAVHLLGVTVWLGGLVALVLLRGTLGRSLPVVTQRYSTLAGIAFVAVAASGVVNAWLRLQSPADLVTTSYGVLILVKGLALTALGVVGWWHRRRTIPTMRDGDRGPFVRLALVEALVMAVTLGVSVALSRSAPPVAQSPITGDVRYELLGFHYPPHVTPLRMLTEFHLDWAFAALALAMAGLYVAAVVRLRRRGDAWSAGRTSAWLVGCFLLLYCTSGGPAVYGSVQFSTHMILHMGLMMFVPLPLVLGAPVLLALRVLPSRTDSSRGPREWILLGVHSWYARILARPAVAGVIFAGSLVAFYFTGWFQASLFDHPVHVLMQVHFLLSGYLFFWLLVGADPGPERPAPPLRLVVLLVTLTFHAFFGIALMSTDALIAADWWHAMGYTNDVALLADQHSAGGIAWGAGEFPTFLAAVIVAVQWQASDKREARRKDRQADRDGDAELVAYNAQLAALAQRDAARDARG